MAIFPGKKAELDKDGISLDRGKVDLDRDGISLKDEDAGQKALDRPVQSVDKGEAEQKSSRKFPMLLWACMGLMLLAGAGGIAWYVLPEHPAQPVPFPVDTVESQEAPLSDGDIILDPFMILYDPHNPRESGVLLAQLSLQITPGTAANIEGNIFAVRSLILERLSTNAQIYSKNELADMLTQDLRDFKVKDVAFIQYESR